MRVTAQDVEDAEQALIDALNEARNLHAQWQTGKVSRDRVKEAKANVEIAERDHLFMLQTYGRQNIEDAKKILGAE